MREILFRGKRVDNGEWVEGQLLYFRAIVGENELALIVESCEWDNSNEWFNLCKRAKVIPETIGQYTGLTDKNGKKIFEGDIISTDIKRPYLIVEFRDGCFMFNCNDGGEDYYDIMLPICKEPHKEYPYGEIIGNIHDNPELVGGD